MNLHVHRLRMVSAALLMATALIGFAPPAAAHEGQGILTVESQAPAGHSAVRYIVRLTWADDGHPALGSTLTATPIAPDGAPQTPVSLEPADEDGRYAATVTYPTSGDWTVRFTSVTPTGTIEIRESVTAQLTSTTEPATSTTATRDANSEDRAPSDATNDDSDPDDGGGSAIGGTLAVAVLAVVVVGAIVGFARSTRRSREDT